MENNILYDQINPNMELIFNRESLCSYPLHTHTMHYAIGYLLEGEIYIENDGRKYLCRKGEYFIVKPDTPHAILAKNIPYTILSICIRSDYLFPQAMSQADMLVCPKNAARDLTSKKTPHTDDYTKQIKECILQEPEKSFSIMEMSQSVCVSQYHLIRMFKKNYGLTPHQFQIQSRVRKAQKMLAAGKSVTEVAYDCGFCDQSHFDRCFQKLVRMTPLNYKNALHR